jgi:hypothetical protein
MKLLIVSTVIVHGVLANTIQLDKRNLTPWGGYPIVFTAPATACPANTTLCTTDTYKDRCCPAGTQCFSESATAAQSYCCPDGQSNQIPHRTANTNSQKANDCSASVTALAACADNSWQLFSEGYYYCCASDQNGFYAGGGPQGYQCLDKSLPIPSTASLTAVSPHYLFYAR